MKWFAFLFVFFASLSMALAGRPRVPVPNTPDLVHQNDQDLIDKIENLSRLLGQTTSSAVTTSTDFPTSGAWGDLALVSLTVGDWLISTQSFHVDNGATLTSWQIGISENAGNSAVGLELGDNRGIRVSPPLTDQMGISSYQTSLSAGATFYFKYRSDYTGGPPQARGRISAVRVK